MKTEKQINDILSFTDDKYLLEAERIDSSESLVEAEKNEKRKRKTLTIKYITSAAACLLVALGIAFAPKILTPSTENSGENTVSTPDIPSVIEDKITPWESGRISLVSMTFKPSESFSAFSLPVEFLAHTPHKTKKLNSSSSPFTPNGSPEPDNVKVSIMSDTKISSFIGGDLVKISADSGEHKSCDGVYYNIREDKTVCMSCEMLSLIRTSDYYIDAYIRSIIEECLITKEIMWAGISDGEYERFYVALDNDTAKEFLKSDDSPSAEKLGISGISFTRSEAEVDRDLLLHMRPVVKIVEYGYDESRLTFTISSAKGSGFWGAFVYDLTTSTLKKLDGETVGLPYCTNGYLTMTPEELVTLNLSLATGITISDDYNKIIATVPYFLNELEFDMESGTFAPIYLAENVVVFNVADGTYNALLGNSSGYDDSVSYPLDIARELFGVYYYPTVNDTWAFHYSNQKYELAGELLKLEKLGNDIYAIMKNGTTYQLYLLGGSEAIPSELPADVMLYAVEGNERTDLHTLEKTTLFEGEPDAMAATKDGRFIYLYYEGESEIVCIDAKYGTKGSLPLSSEFVAQSVSAGNVSFLLFLNSDEDKLLMAYYKNGSLVFDREGYLADEGVSVSPLDPEGAMREYLDETFERNLSSVFEHYYYGNKKMTVKKNENVLSLAKLVCASYVNDLIKSNSTKTEADIKALFADIGEMLAPYFEYSGNTASVNAALVKQLSGGQSAEEIGVAFEYYLAKNIPSDMTVQFQTKEPLDNVTRFVSNGFLKLIYGYWAEVETTTNEDEKKLFNRLNEDVDSEWMNTREKIEPIIRRELEKLLTEENGYCVRSELLVEAVQKLFPEVIETATGMSYPEYIRSCAYLDHFISPDFFSLRSSVNGCVPQMSIKHGYDKEKLKSFLRELDFVKGEVSITQTAMLSAEGAVTLVPFSYYKYCGNDIISVGRDENGNAYAVISGYYATLSDKQYESFTESINGYPKFQRNGIYDKICDEVFERR